MTQKIKTGQQWKRKDDGRIATISRVSEVGVTYTMPDNKGKMNTHGANFNHFFATFTLFMMSEEEFILRLWSDTATY